MSLHHETSTPLRGWCGGLGQGQDRECEAGPPGRLADGVAEGRVELGSSVGLRGVDSEIDRAGLRLGGGEQPAMRPFQYSPNTPTPIGG